MFGICAIEEKKIHESSFCARGSGVSPVKSTFALRRDAGATIGAQILNMSQSTFYVRHSEGAQRLLLDAGDYCLYRNSFGTPETMCNS
jgi:hypothetical protein